MTPSLHYSGLTLDRADHLRRDVDRINQLRGMDQTRILPVFDLKNLINTVENVAITKSQAEVSCAGLLHSEGTFLGLEGGEGGQAVFAVNCTEREADIWQTLDSNSSFVDLRLVGPALPESQAPVLAYARGILHWQRQNPFCALCGSKNDLVNGGHMMCCSSVECAAQLFPRTDPAVIMLVEHVSDTGKRRCLLGRAPSWPEGVFSTLAGFVETGETLEEAVAREVFEESGVRVGDVRYIASQPWPFPQSIMLGFIATAMTDEIEIDPVELAEARWFSATDIAGFGNWGDQLAGPKLPRTDSIARYLIDSWRGSI